MHVLAIHGINTYGVDWLRPLRARMQADALLWGESVEPYVTNMRRLAPLPASPWWRPWRRKKAGLISDVQESVMWTTAYRVEQENIVRRGRCQARRLTQDGALLIVGHSLGTLIAADILSAMGDLEAVAGLITMGSPLAYFALPGDLTAFARRMADHQVPWINLWDRDDLIARPLSGYGARDIEVRTGGLVRSHTGYWGDKACLDIIEEASHEHPGH